MAYVNARSAQQAGLVRLAHHAAYIAEAAYGHVYVPTAGLRAQLGSSWIGVDEHGRIYYDDVEIMSREPFEIAVTFMHETWHTLRQHAQRARTFWAALASDASLAQVVAGMDDGARHKVWNLAGDAEINCPLQVQFGDTPEGAALFAKWITPSALRAKFGIATPDGAPAEVFARAILEKQDPLDGLDPDCGGGSGADGTPQPWEAGEGEGDKPAGKDETALEVMRHETAKSINEAAAAGKIPGDVARWAEVKLAPPKICWERELRTKVRRALIFIAGHDDFTYARPSNQRQAGIILPGTQSPELNVDVVLDDSGSMGNGEGSLLNRAVAEIDGVCKAATRVRFTACDSSVNSHKRTTFEGRATAVFDRFTGGGGTDMRVGIAAALANKPKANVIVVLTDGETPWPDKQPKGCAVVVGLVGNVDEFTRGRVPKWASVVEIKD